MTRFFPFAVAGAAVTIALAGSQLHAHPGHRHVKAASTAGITAPAVQSPADVNAISGQGSMQFRVLYTSDRLPMKAREVLTNAHGGFAVDRRAGQGEVYFALPGAGLLRIASDLQSIDLIDTDAAMRDVNLHNTTLWEATDGTPFLTLPANDAGQIFTTTLAGELVQTLEAPTGAADLGAPSVNDYFQDGGNFAPTDVDHLNGLFYVTTGYSDLDWVLTARVRGAARPEIAWNALAFGGRGTTPGLFGTGHGVTVVNGPNVRIDIADRPHAEIDRFTPEGRYISTVTLPAGSFPCDIDHLDGYSVVGALHGPDRDKGAPVYVLEGNRVISEIWPKEELGLENFQHIHNAVFHRVDGRFYIIVQAWNPGDFAVLEQVTE
jgi:hypothetical protein